VIQTSRVGVRPHIGKEPLDCGLQRSLARQRRADRTSEIAPELAAQVKAPCLGWRLQAQSRVARSVQLNVAVCMLADPRAPRRPAPGASEGNVLYPRTWGRRSVTVMFSDKWRDFLALRGCATRLIHRRWRRSCWSCARPAIGRTGCDCAADRGDVARGLAYQRGARADRERS
jgi:hypothetical protein